MQSFVQYLYDCLTKNNDFVTYEAAKSLCELSETLKLDLESPYNSLLTFIQNGNSVQKYSALKVLNRLASHNPAIVS